MTTHLDPSALILGFPAQKLKAILKSWEKGRKDPESLADLADVKLPTGSVVALLGEARRLGLIGFEADEFRRTASRLDLTRGGIAFVASTGRKRATKAAAAKVLDGVLKSAQELLKDRRAPSRAEKIWVFGSFVKPDKADVGDLDIVVETERRYKGDWEARRDYVDRHYPGLVAESFDDWRGDIFVEFVSKKIFGSRRHPLLAPNYVHTLISMHEPCALLFDAERGGIIEPEFMAHHPDSKGRSSSMQEPLVMPDLKGTADYELTDPIVFDVGFRAGADEADFAALDHFVAKGGETADAFNLRWSANPDVDGIRVGRSVRWGSTAWQYEISVLGDLPEERNYYIWRKIASALLDVAAADLVRLADHRSRGVGMEALYSSITLGDDVPMDHPLRSAIHSCLRNVQVADLLPPGLDYAAELGDEEEALCWVMPDDYVNAGWPVGFPFTKEEYLDWRGEVYERDALEEDLEGWREDVAPGDDPVKTRSTA